MIRWTVSPWCDSGWVWTVIGVPVARWVRATARITRSTPGVSPGSSMAHLSMPARTPVWAIPSVTSPTKSGTMASASSLPSMVRTSGVR